MAIKLNDNITVDAPKPTDSRYLNSISQPYADLVEVFAQVSPTRRYIGLKVLVDSVGGPVEYWWKDGITDPDLVLLTVGGTGDGNVTGPTPSVNNAIPKFTGTGGDALDNSTLTITSNTLTHSGPALSIKAGAGTSGDLAVTSTGASIRSQNGADSVTAENGQLLLTTSGTARMTVTDSGVQLGAGATVTTVSTDAMLGGVSSSDSALATQQAIKTYVDTSIGSGGLGPTFTSFGITGYTDNQYLEINTTLPSSLTFNWGTSFPASVTADSIEITSPAGGTVLATGLSDDGTQTVSVGVPVTSPLTETGKTFRITGNSVSGPFQRDFTLRAGYPLFYGKATGSRPVIDAPAVAAGTKLVVDTTENVVIPFYSTTDEWIWFALPVSSTVPVSWAELENPANVGTIGGATEVGGNLFPAAGSPVSVTTANWSGVSYRVYVSNRKLAVGVNELLVGDVQTWAQATAIASSATTDRLNALDLPGVDPTGATDSTAALQAAVTALSTNASTRELFFPPGIYKFNLLVPEQVRIVGSGCQISGSETKSSNTVFMPWNDALPVLWVKSLFSNYFSDFEMLGNGSGESSTGLGSSVAGLMIRRDPQPDGVTYLYPGMGLVVERVRAERFAIGFHLHSPNSITFNDCSAVFNGIGWRGLGLSDTWLLNNCHGNYNINEQVWVSAPRSVTIRGGDWGNCSSVVVKAENGGAVSIEGINVESVTNTHIFETSNSNIAIKSCYIRPQSGTATAAIVRQTTGNAQVLFDNTRFDEFTAFENSGKFLYWESENTNAPLPIVNNFAGALRYVTDSTYTTTKRLLISKTLESIEKPRRIELRDDFVGGGLTSGIIGALGWHLNNVAGTATVDVSATVAANEFGRLAINSSATANDGYWLTLPSGIQRSSNTANHPWEMVWRILLVNTSGPNVRYGLLGGTPGSNPSDFIGFKYVAGDLPATWKMVCRSGGTSTELDSGVAVTGGYVNLIISSLANGFIRMRVGQDGNEQVISTNIPTGIMVPGCSFFTLVASARMQLIDLFSLTMDSIR